ncbi:MAG: EAL domain-containing protein [Nitrospirae bacterium]|nr:EAL domain-containing protein [Nitrospirota bacterium]
MINLDQKNRNFFISRQPILNLKGETVAFEIIFRSSTLSSKSELMGNAPYAMAHGIINLLSQFGLDQIVGKHKGLIKIDHDLLMGDAIELLPKERIVLELPEIHSVTPEYINRCSDLREAGFEMVMDRHHFNPGLEPLYQIVHMTKIHPFRLPEDQLVRMIQNFRKFPLKILAEKVESREEYQKCTDWGFDLFQGYFFARPSVLEKKPIDEDAAGLLKLMRLLSDDAELDLIEKIFRGSSSLTYKLLLLVNSVGMGVREKIQTVRHAIAIVGRQRLKRWVQLAMFASDDSMGTDNPLMDMAAVRATFMEHLASRHPQLRNNREHADQAFMVGMLSLFESLYNITLEEIVTSLNLSDSIREALSPERQGPIGKLLKLAELMEQPGSVLITPALLEDFGSSTEDILAAQMKAYNWTGEMSPAPAGKI